MHHLELHKERLFDLHIQDALNKVFPQVCFSEKPVSVTLHISENVLTVGYLKFARAT